MNNVYDKNIFTIPVGMGFEYYVTNNFVINGKAIFRFSNSDYLDDLSSNEDVGATPGQDYNMNFGVGLSYYIGDDNDFDNDGLDNEKEEKLGMDPEISDTDGDGLNDGEEVMDFKTNPLMADTDGDSMNDKHELFVAMTSPIKADTDADGIDDDTEIARKTNPTKADSDFDGLIDGEEVNTYKTDPLTADTDNDGLLDGRER